MRLDPHSIAYPLYLRGLAQFCMGQLEEAVTSTERSLTHNPEFRTGAGVLATAYAHLGREKEARAALVNYKKSLLDWMGILHHVMWFWPFKDPEVAERFADGLLKAGLPGQPSGYYKIYEEKNLTGEEIRELVFGRTMRGIDYYKGEFRIDRTRDGKMTYRKVSGNPYDYDDEGTSWIDGDMLCDHWQVRVWELGQCRTLFPNPVGTPEMMNEYFWISDTWIQPFSVVD
jgi:hypothetical protein